MSLYNLSSKINIRIYYEGTDAGGVVYQAQEKLLECQNPYIINL